MVITNRCYIRQNHPVAWCSLQPSPTMCSNMFCSVFQACNIRYTGSLQHEAEVCKII